MSSSCELSLSLETIFVVFFSPSLSAESICILISQQGTCALNIISTEPTPLISLDLVWLLTQGPGQSLLTYQHRGVSSPLQRENSVFEFLVLCMGSLLAKHFIFSPPQSIRNSHSPQTDLLDAHYPPTTCFLLEGQARLPSWNTHWILSQVNTNLNNKGKRLLKNRKILENKSTNRSVIQIMEEYREGDESGWNTLYEIL